MLIGSLADGRIQLDFRDGHSKTISEQQFRSMIVGSAAIKTSLLSEEEFQEFQENLEAKRTGQTTTLNQEILYSEARRRKKEWGKLKK